MAQWSIQHTPSAAAQATISKAAVAGFRHICDGITVTLACGATAQTPLQVVLRDGATGVGAILWSAKVAAPANGMAFIDRHSMGVPGTPGNAMTLEFVGAGAAATEAAVSMSGFDIASS